MRLLVAFASVSLALASPAFAQAGGFTIGAEVLDSSGNPVGTITAVKDTSFLVRSAEKTILEIARSAVAGVDSEEKK